ncbi:hypothetical protein H2201_000689 [Coniosporium apollinis]|uniref:C3H1-type domain-containing protein n=1 Tax=Coniosporium apollinis TaxID=61459 RepID=A0ABQ9PAE1_9PEZI|nr:hypothetical protein H2201_000689 [Coniosporium apollinis]
MGPPIRMGFDNSHPPDPPRPYSTKHDSPNPFPGNNKRKREPPMRGGHSTHQSHNPSFHNQRHQHGKPDKAKAKVAPQVPNFGFAFSTPQAANPPADSTDKPKKKKRRKHNQLGLTPKGEEHEDSEDEIDEEAAFANAGGATPTDLAAWIEERKNRFPTKARIEEKEKEKERRLAEARAARQEEADRRKKRHDEEIEAHQKVKKDKYGEGQEDEQQRKREKYLLKAEKLRRKLEKSERKAAALAAGPSTTKPDSPARDPTQIIAAAEPPIVNDETAVKLEPQSDAVLEPVSADPAMTGTGLETGSATTEVLLPNGDWLPNGLPSVASTTLEDTLALKHDTEQPKPDLGLSYAASTSSDDDSEDSMSISSSSSDPSSDASDSDAPPTETSSRRTGPTKVPPPPRDGTRKPQQGTKVCRYFAKHGRCNLGAKCGFKHERGDEKGGRRERGGMKLFDRLVEQERREEAELALNAIKYLGSNGFLE